MYQFFNKMSTDKSTKNIFCTFLSYNMIEKQKQKKDKKPAVSFNKQKLDTSLAFKLRRNINFIKRAFEMDK